MSRSSSPEETRVTSAAEPAPPGDDPSTSVLDPVEPVRRLPRSSASAAITATAIIPAMIAPVLLLFFTGVVVVAGRGVGGVVGVVAGVCVVLVVLVWL